MGVNNGTRVQQRHRVGSTSPGINFAQGILRQGINPPGGPNAMVDPTHQVDQPTGVDQRHPGWIPHPGPDPTSPGLDPTSPGDQPHPGRINPIRRSLIGDPPRA
ncbi:hypothetical protein TNIN_251301 [Trichonephila inaurata madagascariensis]|uniref:Uncharacterized protein n=1 Tax=Trichonephila inaurata madagascariensis TaxID=2747483 RepID=A0A8X6MLC3_9ARAC|nr:hypothetical protein TNIN_251301 [Trichonephila inaurata madagascariensis]